MDDENLMSHLLQFISPGTAFADTITTAYFNDVASYQQRAPVTNLAFLAVITSIFSIRYSFASPGRFCQILMHRCRYFKIQERYDALSGLSVYRVWHTTALAVRTGDHYLACEAISDSQHSTNSCYISSRFSTLHFYQPDKLTTRPSPLKF